MKKIIYPILMVLMAACADSSQQTELSELRDRRDELRAKYDDMGHEIRELESQIAELDTNRRRTLVTVLPARIDTFQHFFEIYGNVDVKRNALLMAESPGIVKKILVRDGESVSQGQVLFHLDDAVIRKNQAELRTNYDLAKSLFERQERLWEQNIGSEVQYLEAKNRMEGLENALATLQEQLDKTTVRAPFNGVVDEVMIKVGEMAGGAPLARIVDLSEFHIEADVPESYASVLDRGTYVEVVVSGIDTLHAQISTVGSYINAANRTFRILVDVESSVAGRFKPNQLAVLRINDYSNPDAVTLPSVVIQQDAKGENFVFVAETDERGVLRAQKKVLQTGSVYSGQTEVLAGLKGDESIVARGSRSVRDNQAIEITQH